MNFLLFPDLLKLGHPELAFISLFIQDRTLYSLNEQKY